MRSITETIFRYGNWIVAALVIVVLYQAFSGRPTASIQPKFSDEQFTTAIENQSVPVIVKFGATWCPPCRTTDKALEEFEKTSPGKANVLIVDIDANPSLAAKYSVGSIPHSFLFYQGKVIDDQVGGMDTKEINSWLDTKLSQFQRVAK